MGRSGRANASPRVAPEKKGDSYKKGIPYSTRTEQRVKMTFFFLMGFACLLAYQIKYCTNMDSYCFSMENV